MPQARSRKAGNHTAWETQKERLRVLWLERNEKLDQVMNHMASFHDFRAEKWEYEAKFREWDFRKKLKPLDWKLIEPNLRKRKREGKESDVFYHGVLLPAKKVRKEILRNTTQSLEQLGQELPPSIEIRTPKVASSKLVVDSKTMERNGIIQRRLLLPRAKLETGPDNVDFASRMPAEPQSEVQKKNFQDYKDFPWMSLPEFAFLAVDLASLPPREKSRVVLPDWASGYGALLQNLPWFLFHASVSHRAHEQTIFKNPMDGISEFFTDTPSNQLSQQNENIALKRKKPAISAMTAFKRHLHLEEIMPVSFQIDPATSPQTFMGLPEGSSEAQLADVGLFLAANNLLDGDELVSLVERFFEHKQELFLRNLFQVKTPTVRAFSCRVLESISAIMHFEKSDSLIQGLLACGLDPSILTGPTGGRCLQLAIDRGNKDIVSFLLQNGVRKDVKLGLKWPFNATPIHLAESHNNQEILQILGEEHKPVGQQPVSLTWNLKPQKNENLVLLDDACRQGDIEQIRSLLEAGVDVDADRSWNRPVLERIFFDKPDCYQMLLPYSHFAANFWTTSGIVSAADGGLQELEDYLARRSCGHSNDPGTVFDRAISDAIEYDLIDESLTILELEWILDLIDLDGLLVVAIKHRQFEIVAKLVQSGAETDAFDLRDLHDVMTDVLFETPQSLKQLLDIGWPFTVERAFTETLLLTSEYGRNFNYLRILKTLAKRGLDLNIGIEMEEEYVTYPPRTPLQLAINWGTLKMVKFLVDAGAMVNGTAGFGHGTALTEAVKWGKPDIVEFLLDKDADIQAFPNDQGMTLLELSVSDEHIKHPDSIDMLRIFQALLERGADINGPKQRPKTASWNTALTTAILNSYYDELIYLALNAGADVNQMGGGEIARTPLQAAAERGRTTIAKELLNRGAHINTPAAPNRGMTALQAACAERSQEMIELLLSTGADVNAPPAAEYGRTALQALCTSEKPCSELVALLIEKGANIHAPAAPCGGVTALQGAAIMGNLKIAMILIDMGVDINVPAAEREGRMALDGAAEHGRLDTVQLLLNFGATCTEPGNTGYDSAIKFAEENGHSAVVDVLMKHKNWSLDTEMFELTVAGGLPA